MTPIELGSGIADTNTVPGVKHRSFYAVLASGARVVIDAVNRTIIIDKTGQTGAMSAVVGDSSSSLALTGATGKTGTLSAGAQDASLALVGGATGGVARSVVIDTAAAHAVGAGADLGDKGRPLSIVAIRDCEPNDPAGQVFNRLILASARFRVS